MIESYQQSCETDSKLKLSRNAATQNEITDLAMDWNQFRKIDHSFSNTISGEMKITNQKSSGRCWGFAGLNLFRIYLGRKHNIRNFEFSQTYFMFWDKLEKSNYFLNSIIQTAESSSDSRIIMHLLESPIQDGGQWDMWVNLINKYGVVPKSEMPETYQSSQSMRMNRMITRKLREFAKELRYSIKNNINNNWPYTLNQINFRIDRFSVDKSETYNYDKKLNPPAWTGLPSATPVPDPIDSKDFYVLFPRQTILPDETQY